MKKAFFLIIASLVLFGCNQTQSPDTAIDAHDHGDNMNSVTMWSDQMELFMEFAPLISKQESQFIVHLTKLENFKPVTSGQLSFVFEPHGGQPQTIVVDGVARDGIFLKNITIEKPDEYDVLLKYSGEGITETFDLGHIEVFADEAEMEAHVHGEADHAHTDEDADHAHTDDHDETAHGEDGHDHDDDSGHQPADDQQADDHAHGAADITFLKEQQWKTEFQTAFGRIMKIKSSIMAISEIIPHQHGYAEVVSPVEGYLNIAHNEEMVIPGTRINKGDVLVVVCPHVGRSNTWTERKLSYERAEKNFDRAKNLLERNAISQREFEEIRQDYLIEKAGFETLVNTYGAEINLEDPTCGHFQLKAPIDGIVAEVLVLPGQTVEAGANLVTIIDPSVVWLRADIYEKDYYKLGKPDGATLYVSGLDEHLHLNANELLLLNKSDLVNKQSRTVPVLFEIANKDRKLKIGQVVQADIYTANEQESLCVPEDAILDEDSQKVVFVQHEGEAFEKRVVKPGPHYNGWVAIKDGLHKGERVVTQGVYFLKLASVTTAVGAAHVH
jgi:membrane fusion protein, heavy metal efflux system